MSREKEMRKRVVRALRPLHAISVENGCGVGTPDVNYADGWIELKVLEDWPARDDTVVRVDLFTKEQRMWHRARAASGGTTWVLLKVDRDWLLFEGRVAAESLGFLARPGLISISRAAWFDHLDEMDLRHVVRGG